MTKKQKGAEHVGPHTIQDIKEWYYNVDLRDSGDHPASDRLQHGRGTGREVVTPGHPARPGPCCRRESFPAKGSRRI